MTSTAWTELCVYLVLLVGLSIPLGAFMARVMPAEQSGVRGWETWLSRLGGVSLQHEMTWRQYAGHLLAFHLFGFLVLMALQLLQASLPLNPAGQVPATWHLAFNTAASFTTNTNWQSYGGEVTYGYLVQMLGLAVQNFVSAGTGIAVAIAVARGLGKREEGAGIGNFYADLARAVVLVLLPLSAIFALVLVGQGVVQNFSPYVDAQGLEGVKQRLPMGPAASQIAIKQLGTNGGGFFNVNSAHPFENPTPFSNFLQMFAILWIAGGLALSYGRWVKSTRQGWAVFTAMFIMFVAGLSLSLWSEYAHNPAMGAAMPLEGKEVRNTPAAGVLWSVATTAASNGSVNTMHDSLSPLSGFVTLFNIHLGEVVFGGVGAGLYGILAFVILAVFIAGLMVGRTPEYLGKKVEGYEVRMAVLTVLVPSALCLFFTALAAVHPEGLKGRLNMGPHGFSEILYAFSSAAGNNGSAFGGLTANTPFYNVLLGLTMILARFTPILAMLALAGNMAAKKPVPASAGTFPTDRPLFVFLLIGVVIIVGALTFLPALFLGPIVEHFLMLQGRTF